MISFTEIETQHSSAHCSVFGYFGIVISDEWARKHRAQRVVYVDEEGPFTDALKELFSIGYKDVTARIEYPDDKGWLLAYENKNAAGAIAGSRMWYDLLTLWEYLEPAASACQREWRVVNPQPLYSLRQDKAESIAQISPPQGWAKWDNLVPIRRGDVEALVCRTDDVDLLRKRIPDAFSGVEIVQTTF